MLRMFRRPHLQAVTSQLGIVETEAALVRRAREEHLSERDLRRAIADIDAGIEGLAVADLTPAVSSLVPDLLSRQRLRGSDCVHLATAVLVSGDDRGDWMFVCADARLLAAARAEGFPGLDPSA